MQRLVTTTCLEMTDRSPRRRHRSFLLEITRDAFRPKPFARRNVRLVRASASQHARCRALWLRVGRGFWTSRTRWTGPRWRQHLRDENVSFWFASLGAEDIGFFELVAKRNGVKIEGFGLLPAWRSKGMGAGLLSAATCKAFEFGGARVWLHTATDDHPNALPNYQARGYRISRERELKKPLVRWDAPERPRGDHHGIQGTEPSGDRDPARRRAPRADRLRGGW